MNTCTDALRFCPSASKLLDQWLILRPDATTCPSRKNFDPMTLGGALPDVFLVECHNDDLVSIRVAGSQTKNVTQKDRTGENVFDICHPSHVESVKSLYNRVCSEKVAAMSEYISVNKYGRFTAKSLHLPLLGEDNSVQYIVGVTKALPITEADKALEHNAHAHLSEMHVVYVDLFTDETPAIKRVAD